MILLQLSAGQGPQECSKALGLAMNKIQKRCSELNLKLDIIETVPDKTMGCYKSALLQLEGEQAKSFASSWQGVMLWVCQSPFRSKHKRKNWYFSGQLFEVDEVAEALLNSGIKFQTCRASGAGGQHVNTTDSAVRATHIATGISVRVENERSQHANKRLAKALIVQKLEALKYDQMTEQEQKRWQQHWDLERGNPVQTFKGESFVPKMKNEL